MAEPQPQALVDEIFGGDSDLSDLSDVEEEEYEAEQPAREERIYRDETPSDDEEPGDDADAGGDDDYRESRAGPSQRAPADENDEGEVEAAKAGKLKFKKTASKERPAGEPRKRKQKRKAAEDAAAGDEEPLPIDPAEQRKMDLYARIDQAAKGDRPKKRKRRDGDDDLEAMADEEVIAIRQNMMVAAEQDIEANEAKRPATAKLVLLPTVIATMQKSHLETSILENGVLDAVRKWLEPLNDKSLPALNVQRALFGLLLKMSIDTQSLKSSELGKVVLFYTKCKRVEPGIKRIADQLVMTWMRPLLRRSANYRNRQALLVQDPSITSARASAAPPRIGSQSANASGVAHARIPETIHQAYSVAPVSQTQAEGMSRIGIQRATAKKSRDFAKKIAEARKGERRGL